MHKWALTGTIVTCIIVLIAVPVSISQHNRHHHHRKIEVGVSPSPLPSPSPADVKDVSPPPADVKDVPPPPADVKDVPPPPAGVKDIPPPPAGVNDIPPPPADVKDIPPPPADVKDIPAPPADVKDIPAPPADVKDIPPPPQEPRQSLVQALFIYGDSLSDVGNNKYLKTQAQGKSPTGRFCNGKLGIDYLAELLNITTPRPYLSGISIDDMMTQGANMASGGAGILLESGSDLGEHIPFEEQIGLVAAFQKELSAIKSDKEANEFMNETLHYVSIGSNDYIHSYFTGRTLFNDSSDFSYALIQRFEHQMHVLFGFGVRKIAVAGVGPLGCTPHFITKQKDCIEEINEVVNQFNTRIIEMVERLRHIYPDLKITYLDSFDPLKQLVNDYDKFGFEAADDLWFDEFHPSEKANDIIAGAVWPRLFELVVT